MTDKDPLDLTQEVEGQEAQNKEDEPCQTCPEEASGCTGCGGKREEASSWWYIIALLVILILALVFRRQGGGT